MKTSKQISFSLKKTRSKSVCAELVRVGPPFLHMLGSDPNRGFAVLNLLLVEELFQSSLCPFRWASQALVGVSRGAARTTGLHWNDARPLKCLHHCPHRLRIQPRRHRQENSAAPHWGPFFFWHAGGTGVDVICTKRHRGADKRHPGALLG